MLLVGFQLLIRSRRCIAFTFHQQPRGVIDPLERAVPLLKIGLAGDERPARPLDQLLVEIDSTTRRCGFWLRGRFHHVQGMIDGQALGFALFLDLIVAILGRGAFHRLGWSSLLPGDHSDTGQAYARDHGGHGNEFEFLQEHG